jgi:hypothetical protein
MTFIPEKVIRHILQILGWEYFELPKLTFATNYLDLRRCEEMLARAEKTTAIRTMKNNVGL